MCMQVEACHSNRANIGTHQQKNHKPELVNNDFFLHIAVDLQ